jgi:hypothetical protein
MKKILGFMPLLLMIVVAISVMTALLIEGRGLFLSALIGATVGFISVWFIIFSCYRIWIFITRGAPFEIGDRVLITSGFFQGHRGVVTKISGGYNAVFVRIQDNGEETQDHLFEWGQLTKRHKLD